MSFSTLPASVQEAIQQNYLQKEFQGALESVLKYRLVAEKIPFSGRVGTTITQTRVGLIAPNTTPLNPSTNTNLDNGLTAQQFTSEQYTVGIQQYPQLSFDVNLIDDETTIKSFVMKNSYNLGMAAAQTTERLARNSLFGSYLSANTRIITTLGSPNVTVHVDDIRGFQTVLVNGVVTPVSSGNPLPTLIGSDVYNITAYLADVSNISSAAITGGISGTITASATVTVADATAGNAVVSLTAPLILRPNARATTAALISSDLLNMQTCFAAVASLRNNAVPTINGRYNFYVSPTSMIQLFNDPEFQILNRGVGTDAQDYRDARITEFLDMRFIETTEAFVQPNNGNGVTQTIQRPIACGADVLVEAQFAAGMDAIEQMIASDGFGKGTTDAVFPVAGYDGYMQYMRPPLDRLGQIISQTSNWVGGYSVPTDVGTTTSIVPTSSGAYYKRAVVIETAS